MRIASVAVGVLALTAVLVPSTVQAADPLPTAAVSMGDSYMAGEAGRWLGNSSSDWGDRRGTDRAAYFRRWRWQYQEERAYGDTYATGCHRSDVAPLDSAQLRVSESFNIACSGASTRNVIPSSSGGRSHSGEPPQADQLAALAATHDIELVVLTIGGNDLGFSDIIIDCVVGYVTSTRWAPNTCHEEQDAEVAQRMPAAMAGVEASLRGIRKALADSGDTSYRLVLQSYPAPLPPASEFRYPESSWKRVTRGGCPFWNVDADWAARDLIPTFTAELRAAAAANDAEFLDLSAALSGREACADSAAQGSGPNAEWIRFVNTGLLQGDAEESVHPNALGQQAMGRCLQLLAESAPGNYRCTNTPGRGPSEMIVSATQ